MPKVGGKREGAGRPLGSIDRKTKAMLAKQEGKLMPLDYMFEVMRDPKIPRRERAQAARDAAPYCHPRLSSTEHKGPADGPIQVIIKGSDKGLL